ncbi:unnamed protein product [Blepharisma stoltei]|uniref:Anaphase-promoting complex subunit 4-like WD40 domain-containing protein n=1 Tax=Blepharisma stoltei TaxID=1481888 RepID=A0AAU9J5X9_9CILI|nr:unnamed protein product [Blepharisma stoltei]
MSLQCEQKQCKVIPSFICACSLKGHLFCKVHIIEHIESTPGLLHKGVSLFFDNSAQNICKFEDILPIKCSIYIKTDDNIDRSLNSAMSYAGIIIQSLNVHNRKFPLGDSATLESQNLLLSTQFLSPSPITTFQDLFYKISIVLATHILRIGDISSLKASYINKINFINQKEILKCFKSLATKKLQAKLLIITLQSRKHKSLKYASSNAITILNYSKYKFIDKDLHGIKIKGADLSEALIINSNFQGSNLKRVDFYFANIYDTNFKDCDLTDVRFGKYPPFKNRIADWNATFSWNKDYLAYIYSNVVFLQDIKSGCVFKEFEHKEIIKLVALSEDGSLLAIADTSYILHIWDIVHDKKLTELPGLLHLVTSIAFSPKGGFVAAGSRDGYLRIWNIATSSMISCFNYNSNILSVEYSACGKYIVLGAPIYLVPVVYAENIKITKCSFNHPRTVTVASFSPCSRYIITDCDDLNIRIWAMETGELMKSIKMSVSRPNNLFDLSFSDVGIEIQTMPLLKCLAKNWQIEIKWFNETLFNKTSLSFSPDGNYVAIKKTQNDAEIWDAKALESHILPYKEITSISLSYDGKYMAYTDASKSIKIQNIEKNINIFKLKGHQARVMHVLFSKISYFLVSLCVDSIVIIWDTLNQYPLGKIEIKDQVSALDLSFENNFIGVGLLNGNVKVINTKIISDSFSLTHNGAITCIKFSPCEKFIAVVRNDGKLILWRINKNIFVSFGNKRMKEVSCICFAQLRNYLVSAHINGDIIFWDINNQQQAMKVETYGRVIRSIALSPCENYLVAGYYDGFVRVLSTLQGKIIKSLQYHRKSVCSVEFINSEKLLFASASIDATINFWRI